MTTETKWKDRQFTVMLPKDLQDRVRAHRARMELKTGLKVNLSEAYRGLLEIALHEVERNIGRKR